MTAPSSTTRRSARRRQKIKLGRPGKLEDIMGAIVSRFRCIGTVTGPALMLDGGWTAQ